MLWRNFFRDLKSTAARLVSVIIITLIAITVHTGLYGIIYNIDRITGTYNESQNTADYWISGAGLNMEDVRALAALSGVTGVQPRITAEAQERGNEDLTLRLYAVPEYNINAPYLMAGALPASHREMVISDVYAAANGLAIGDDYEVTLLGSSVNLRLQISGLVKSPECLFHVNATTPTPQLDRFGFAYMNSAVLEDIMGRHQYNQICITVDGSVSDGDLRRAVNAALGNKVFNILSRRDNSAAAITKNMTDDLKPIIVLFPFLFFLCAVLLMVNNMSRLIENSRLTIGTFKALGYTDGTILWYYLLHAVLVVLVGFPLGVLPSKPVAWLIVDTLAMGSDFLPYQILPDYNSWVTGFFFTALCCVGSAWLVAHSLLRETPASCMRPKPPQSSKPVVLERINALWRRFTFNQKYIVRNTLRNKPRMITCVLGIAFCMGLVFAAFALRDSLNHYADALLANQNQYDIMVSLNGRVTEGQYQRLAGMSEVTASELEMNTACRLYSDDKLTTTWLTVLEDEVALHLYDPYASGPLTLPPDGIVMDEAVANRLGISEGEQVGVRFTGESKLYPMTVVRVQRSIGGTYVSRSFWRSMGRAYSPSTAYLRTADRPALVTALDRYDFVQAWQTCETVTGAAAEQLRSSALVAFILILFGGGLACIVIYNLGIMSFFEQTRNLATLMVLGFYDKEIKRLQLSENIIFALLGILFGLPIGIALSHVFVAVLSALPLMVATTPLSFVLSCAITLLFALAVNLMIGRKMKTIDMLGALKSVE